MRRTGWLAAWPAGAALGAVSVLLAHSDPDLAFADSGASVVAELLAGYALIACGLMSRRRVPGSRFGVLLAAGGCGWFLLEWNDPGVGSPVVFTIGLALYAAAPPLVAHALLAYPAASLGHRERAVLAVAYGGSLLALGLLPALVFDPAGQGCSQCPRNLLLIHSSPSLYRDLNRGGVYVGLGWTLLVITLAVWRIARSTAALRRVIVPVLAAGGVYMGLVAADFAASLRRGYLSNDPLDRRLWLGEAAALVALALAVTWSWVRERGTRAALARLVVELVSPGRLEPALARSLGDPGLRLAYPLEDGRYVDADGRRLDPGQAPTPLVRDGVEVAVLTHRPGLLDDPGLVKEVVATARLALDNERLHAELLAQLADLRASRARIVITSDDERRRLERDLHDGAQQRLVTLTLTLRLARTHLEHQLQPDRTLITRVEQADEGLRATLAELRKLATGIFPAVLADEGLAPAVEALAEETKGQMRITKTPEQRFDPQVETAAYRLISETVRQAGTSQVTLTALTRDGILVLELESQRPPTELRELEDRLGALDGTLHVAHATGGQARIRAEIPCGS
jgi:signal transduction histidine kinase